MSIRLKRVLICASLAGGLLVLGAGAASAQTTDPGALTDRTQTATNTNSTDHREMAEVRIAGAPLIERGDS
jgi:hypothetical protein